MVSNFKLVVAFRNLIYMTCFSVVLIMMCSCEMVINADLPLHRTSITLNGIIHPDSTLQISLTENRFILDDSDGYTPILDATVKLYSGTQLVGTLKEDSLQGIYGLAYRPEAGVAYRITASKEGLQTVEAMDIIPAEKAVFNIKSVEEKQDEYGSRIYQLTYTIDDPAGENYYETRLHKLMSIYEYYHDEDTAYSQLVGQHWAEIGYNPVGADLNEFEENRLTKTISDELFDGRKKEFKIEFYEYGYYNDIYMFTDQNWADTLQLSLEVRMVSEGYYNYMTTKELQENVDGNIIAEPAPVFNNIKNGYGVFAGYNSRAQMFEIIITGE